MPVGPDIVSIPSAKASDLIRVFVFIAYLTGSLFLLQNRALVKDSVTNDRPLVRGEDDMDLAVARLDRRWISKIAGPFGNVSPMRKRLRVVCRNGRGQRGAIGETVVVNQQQVAVAQPDEVHRGIGIREFGIDRKSTRLNSSHRTI